MEDSSLACLKLSRALCHGTEMRSFLCRSHSAHLQQALMSWFSAFLRAVTPANCTDVCQEAPRHCLESLGNCCVCLESTSSLGMTADFCRAENSSCSSLSFCLDSSRCKAWTTRIHFPYLFSSAIRWWYRRVPEAEKHPSSWTGPAAGTVNARLKLLAHFLLPHWAF